MKSLLGIGTSMNLACKEYHRTKIIKALNKFNFYFKTESKHTKYQNDKGDVVILPKHNTIKGITILKHLVKAGIDIENFFNLCK